MEIKGPLSSQGIFPCKPVMVFTAAASPRLLKRLKEVYYTQLFWDFEIHVISQCQDLFPSAFSSTDRSRGSDVGIGTTNLLNNFVSLLFSRKTDVNRHRWPVTFAVYTRRQLLSQTARFCSLLLRCKQLLIQRRKTRLQCHQLEPLPSDKYRELGANKKNQDSFNVFPAYCNAPFLRIYIFFEVWSNGHFVKV